MSFPTRLTFRDTQPSQAVTLYVEKHAAKLAKIYQRITGCHVVVDAPHHHHRQGGHFRISIDIAVPGLAIVVNRDPDEHTGHEDVFAAIDDAFDDARRRLKDYARRRRGEIKTHSLPTAPRANRSRVARGE